MKPEGKDGLGVEWRLSHVVSSRGRGRVSISAGLATAEAGRVCLAKEMPIASYAKTISRIYYVRKRARGVHIRDGWMYENLNFEGSTASAVREIHMFVPFLAENTY